MWIALHLFTPSEFLIYNILNFSAFLQQGTGSECFISFALFIYFFTCGMLQGF